jgi:hypothetical protein
MSKEKETKIKVLVGIVTDIIEVRENYLHLELDDGKKYLAFYTGRTSVCTGDLVYYYFTISDYVTHNPDEKDAIEG